MRLVGSLSQYRQKGRTKVERLGAGILYYNSLRIVIQSSLYYKIFVVQRGL